MDEKDEDEREGKVDEGEEDGRDMRSDHLPPIRVHVTPREWKPTTVKCCLRNTDAKI